MADLFTRVYDATKSHEGINAHVVRHLDAGYTGTSEDWYQMSRFVSSFLNRLIISKLEKLPRSLETERLATECRHARTLLGDINDELDIDPWIAEFKSELLPILVKIW